MDALIWTLQNFWGIFFLVLVASVVADKVKGWLDR